MRSECRYRFVCVLLGCCFVSQLFTPAKAEAYNEATHQRLTELAWGYMKLSSECAGTPQAETGTELDDAIAQCSETCESETRPRLEDNAGYGCGCLAQLCESECDDPRLNSELERTLCAEECAAEAMQLECGNVAECQPPLYVRPDNAPDFLAEVEQHCLSICYEASHILPAADIRDATCSNFYPALAVDSAAASQTDESIDFFSSFAGLPCPARAEYQYGSDNNVCRQRIAGTQVDDFQNVDRLSDWSVGVYAVNRTFTSDSQPNCDSFAASFTCYQPFPPGSFSAANFTNQETGATVDLTGTILGFHSASVDFLEDLHAEFRFMATWEELVDTALLLGLAQLAAPAVAALAVAGVFACGIGCLADLLGLDNSCTACFSALGSTLRDIIERVAQWAETIEGESLLSTGPDANPPGFPLTSMTHFMQDDGIHDDQDGYQANEAFGGIGFIGGATHDLLTSHYVDIRIAYPESKTVLENYYVDDPDDGMADSDLKNVTYWVRQSLANVVMPPIDNLAYYWWHKWWEGRNTGYEQYYGLVPLGGVLHGAQDLTVPHHARSVTGNGHRGYENDVQSRLDPILASIMDPGNQITRFIYDLSDPEDAALFVNRVTFELNSMRRAMPQPVNDQVLNVRRLFHHLYQQSLADGQAGLFDFAQCGSANPDCTNDLNPDDNDAYLRRVALPRAVAASVFILTEAGGGQVEDYATVFNLPIASFEDETVPPLAPHQDLGRPKPPTPPSNTVSQPLSGAGSPVEQCLEQSSRLIQAATEFEQDQLTTGEFMQIAEEEKYACELSVMGLPPAPAADLTAIAEYTVGQRAATVALMANGDLLAYETDVACLKTRAAYLLGTAHNAGPVAQRCQGTLDSDGDGVMDQDDFCRTNPDLLLSGFAVQSNGCVWAHDSIELPEPLQTIPGTRATEVR